MNRWPAGTFSFYRKCILLEWSVSDQRFLGDARTVYLHRLRPAAGRGKASTATGRVPARRHRHMPT